MHEVNLLNQLGPDFWLLLKSLCLSKPLSLYFMALCSMKCAKTHQCFKKDDHSQHLAACGLEAWPAGSSWESVQSNPFWGETGMWAFLPASSVLNTGVQLQEMLLHLCKNCFFFCCNPVGRVNVSPVGSQT